MSVRLSMYRPVEVEVTTPKKVVKTQKIGPKDGMMYNVRVLWEDDNIIDIRLSNGNVIRNIPKDAIDTFHIPNLILED